MNKQVEDVMLLPARLLLVVLTILCPMMPKGHPCQTVLPLRGWLEQRSPDAFITGLTMWVVVALVVISLLIHLL
jgi:hypothetical protein